MSSAWWKPGQAHRFVNSKDTAGWILFIDSSFFGYLEKSTFDKFALFASSVKIDNQRMSDLKQIASILSSKMDHITNELAKATARRLAETFVSMVAEALQEFGLQRHTAADSWKSFHHFAVCWMNI